MSGTGPLVLPHHIMKLQPGARKLELKDMVQPFVMFRGKDKKDDDYVPTPILDGDKKRFKKKSKQYFLPREEKDVVLGGGDQITAGTLITSIGSRIGDPDKLPWQLKDAEGQGFEGKLEGSQSSNHVLFVSTDSGGFKVIPATHRTLTIEEAEEKMNAQKKANDRWLMRAEAAAKEAAEGIVKGKDKAPPVKAWRQKLMGINPESMSSQGSARQKGAVDEGSGDDAGIDFDEGFSDDEDINFGMDDQEEAKEAQKRLFDKGVAGREETDETMLDASGKVDTAANGQELAKSLFKRENLDVYDGLGGPENPYWSDLDEDDEDAKSSGELAKPPGEKTNSVLAMAKKRQQRNDTGSSTPPSRATSASPAPDAALKLGARTSSSNSLQPAKRQKRDDDAKPMDADSPPPPPSGLSVLKQKLRQEKRKGSRGPSASPRPQSPAPTVSAAPAAASDGPDELTPEILIQTIKSKPDIKIREVIGILRPYLAKEDNKIKFKRLLKQYANHDKTTELVTLKN
ncbi:hypothetical protein HDU91_005412 [Kappamyces sp. JEL0680]|nr:hypothetical protein HDU91_005412 [Kappamyces sp. JEL0680]